MATSRKTINFLPDIFKTDVNKKFLGATLDQLISEPKLSKINGFIGRRFSPAVSPSNNYIQEPTTQRGDYQFEPAVVVKNSSNDLDLYSDYTDLVDKIDYYGGITDNQDRLFESEYYSYTPRIDLDKFINYTRYYWLPTGPTAVPVSPGVSPTPKTFTITKGENGYTTDQTGSQINPDITLVRGVTYQFDLDQSGSEFWIQSEPGLDGLKDYNNNVSSRLIYGTTDNGNDSGILTFTVPDSQDQDYYFQMPLLSFVDYAVSESFSSLDGNYWYTGATPVGEIDGSTRYPNLSYIIFVSNSTDPDDWVDYIGNVVPVERRSGVWQITVDPDSRIKLTYIRDIPIGYKVRANKGSIHTGFEFFKNTTGNLLRVPAITAPLSVLYYQDSLNSSFTGRIFIVEASGASIDVVTDILGKLTYTSPNGIVLTNGLKISFATAVTPALYRNKSYIVEGVGIGIKLIDFSRLNPIESNAPETSIPFDTEPFDSSSFDQPVPGTPIVDYIIVNRASIDLNAWSRGNFWFHEDVIIKTAEYTGVAVTIDHTQRATRPIIEFEADLQLFNNGRILLNAIDRADLQIKNTGPVSSWVKITDAFTQIHNKAVSDPSIELMRYVEQQVAIFPNDIDINVRSKLFRIDFKDRSAEIVFDGTGTGSIKTIAGSTRVTDAAAINETPTTDFRTEIEIGTSLHTASGQYIGKVKSIANGSELLLVSPAAVSYTSTGFKYNKPRIELVAISTADAYDTVVVKTGINAKQSYWFNGSTWTLAQQKTSVNQSPLFDVVDNQDRSFSDPIAYRQNKFAGNKIFSYKTGLGTNDAVLGFSLSYSNIGNSIADINFDNNFEIDSFTYNPVVEQTKKVSTGYLRKNIDRYNSNRVNVWATVAEPSKQYQHITNEYDGQTSYFEIDILPATETNEPNIKVFINNKIINRLEFSIESIGIRNAININRSMVEGDKIDILIYNNQSVSKLGYYGIPSNLEFNAQNLPIESVTLGQLRGHWNAIGRNTSFVTGEILASNNLRDLDTRYQSGVILQHSSPTIYSSLFLIDSQVNLMSGIELARRDYTKFKNKFLELCLTTEGLDPTNPSDGVETILKIINGVKNSTFAWHYTDMLAWGKNYVTDEYKIVDIENKIYSIANIYATIGDSIYPDSGLTNKGLLVYLNDRLLVVGLDYLIVFGTAVITLTTSIIIGDMLVIKGYKNTDGSYIPETPTKLGLFPKHVPSILTDTTYRTPVQVIQGHDGSLTPVFGDLRDTYLIELERRIYNNLKIEYNTQLFDIMSVMPGKFRQRDYSIKEFNQVLNTEFLKWVGTNQIDFGTNEFFRSNDPFTWNYNQTSDTIDGETLLGYWRGIYKYFYDTDRPHSHPWEMLGITEKPDWWEFHYGSAPYQSDNIMWIDLKIGYSRGTAAIDETYARPGLLNIIPVDINGTLLPPTAHLVKNFDGTKFSQGYIIGDHGPVESAWRRTSEYPFALQRALALLKPARYFGLLFDSTAYQKDTILDQYIIQDTNKRVTAGAIVINGENDTARASGYLNWIHGHLTNLGIDAAVHIRTVLNNLDVKLGYKIAGYTDKKYITALLEQFSPNSTSQTVIVPDENYVIHLNKSVPIRRATYSAVIVEKSGTGYRINGYNLHYPYFTVIPSEFNNNAYVISALTRRATIFNDYKKQKIVVPYGYEFKNEQQVVDFLIGYERYLTSQGFVFNKFDTDLKQLTDWVLSAKEFLTWSLQGWRPGNVIVLSPVSYILKIYSADSVVDAITNQIGNSQILGPNFNIIRNDETNILREPGLTTITVISGQTIAFAELNLVQYEHALVFDNVTVFNDIVYKPELGSRQYRLKLVGNKTGDWDGALNPPGFIYNTGKIDEWQPGRDFIKADIVKYKNQNYTAIKNIPGTNTFNFDNWSILDRPLESGLIPNFALNASKFIDIYDIDSPVIDENFDTFSNGLIGYRSRSYLEDLGMDQNTQSKFYQGYIKEKGTKNSISALFGGQFDNLTNELGIFEEWGLRVGEYGATRSKASIELILDESKFKNNPSVFKLLNSSDYSIEPVISIRPRQLLARPMDYKVPIFLDRPMGLNYETDIKSAGYVNVDDVDFTLFDFSNFSALGTQVLSSLVTGFKLWVAKDFNNDWQVYKVMQANNTVVTVEYSLDNKIKVTTNFDHGLQIGDVFAIRDFSDIIDGFYQVLNVETPNTLITIVDIDIITALLNNTIDSTGSLFILQKSRYTNIASREIDVTKNFRSVNDTVWVDDIDDGTWAVYKYNSGDVGSYSGINSFWGIEQGSITLRATGLPYHSYGNVSIDMSASVQNYNRSWPLYAGSNIAATIQTNIGTGLIGFWLNGVAIYSPEGPDYYAPGDFLSIPELNYNLAYSDYSTFNKDLAGGTIPDDGQYFYRNFSFAEVWTSGVGATGQSNTGGAQETESIPYLNGGLTHNDNHSKILGFAVDGYPIYGPYGYSSPLVAGSVSRMQTGYTIRSSAYRAPTEACDLTAYPMGMFIQDYVFLATGHLDAHNGRFCVTPEYPSGTYAYFTTVDSGGAPVYPYVIGPTYYGNLPEVGNSLIGGPGIAPIGFTSMVDVSWTKIVSQTPVVDINSIAGMYLFNNVTKIILTRLDFIDPAKGRILGTAQADIDFTTSTDPARYNQGTSTDLPIDLEYSWGEQQIGMIWWDLDVCRFFDYEQSDLEYRTAYWGKLFPGSSIHVYEWVASDVLPSAYVEAGQVGIPKFQDDSAYVTLSYVDSSTNILQTKFYFWVRGKTTVTLPSKSHSVSTLTQMIESPIMQNIPYAAVLRGNSIALYNIGRFLNETNTALHIDYNVVLNENIIHSEFELFQEGNKDSIMHPRIEDKLIDSIVGADLNNGLVPDPSLPLGDRIGLSVRPRQTLIINRLKAVKDMITFINEVLIKYPVTSRIINKETVYSDNFYAYEPIPDTSQFDYTVNIFEEVDYMPEVEAGSFIVGKKYIIIEIGTTDFTVIGSTANTLGVIFTATGPGTGTGYAYPSRILVKADFGYGNRWTIYQKNIGVANSLIKIQSYNTTNLWSKIDWYANGYDSKTIIIDYTINKFHDIYKLNLVVGDVIKVKDNGAGLFEIYKYNSSSRFDLVALETGTIQLSQDLWKPAGFDYSTFDTETFDFNFFTELRYILKGIKEDIFVRDLAIYYNQFLFFIVEFILAEQKYVDWIFKTSFISISHRLQGLIQTPFYVKDRQTFYEQYIKEVKPYRTKLREYVMTYHTSESLDKATVTDFDLPSYYDSDLQIYRSPNGQLPSKDTELLNTKAEYQDWNNHYTYQLSDIVIANGGRGFVTEPDISIVSNVSGTGASARSVIDSADGSISNIYVTNPGNGYTTTPIVAVTGTGTTPMSQYQAGNYKQAVISARINNTKVRKLKTILRFDRVQYLSQVVDWTANTSYAQGTYVSYLGKGYVANSSALAATFFDNAVFTPVNSAMFDNANDRIFASYSPTVSMVPKVLSRLMTGLDNSQAQTDPTVTADTAIQGGAFTGSAIPAGQFVVGETYIITVIGNTDYTLIGALDNKIGLQFTATGPGTGTGSAAIAISANATSTIDGISAGDIAVHGGAFVYEIFSHAPEELLPGIVFDAVSIYSIDDSGVGYRRFTNMNTTRITSVVDPASNTALAQPLAITDTEINVADGSVLAAPNPIGFMPGIIHIGGERIEYYTKVGNTLGQIRRGVGGTSTPMLHSTGSNVENANVASGLYS